jgi:hypothetical protein
MKWLRVFWDDVDGFVATADLIMISTIIVLGALVGLVTMRDQVVQELGDLAVAIGHLNQSYSFSDATVGGFSVAGSLFFDRADDCEEGLEECVGTGCIAVGGIVPTGEQ